MGIHFSEDSAAIIDEYLDKRNISFDSLANSETDINRLQDSLFETVKQYLKEVECSGAFMLLDTTVNTDLDDEFQNRHISSGQRLRNRPPGLSFVQRDTVCSQRSWSNAAQEMEA